MTTQYPWTLKEVLEFATMAHGKQLRRNKGLYINHPIRMMEESLRLGYSLETSIVCILHDVVEDTDYGFIHCHRFLITMEGRDALDILTKRKHETSKIAMQRVIKSGNHMALLVKRLDALDNANMDEDDIIFARDELGKDPEKEIKRYKDKAIACENAMTELGLSW